MGEKNKMECCKTKKDHGCCKDLKKTEMGHSSESQMKGGNFKMERRMVLWVAIGILFLAALYLIFQTGSNVGAESIGSTTNAAASAASSSGMVGGC